MKVSLTIDFEFSGCEYHPPPPEGAEFDLAMARAFLAEAGNPDASAYQLNLYRDLFLALGRRLADTLETLEPEIRKDVKARRGYDEWSPETVAARV